MPKKWLWIAALVLVPVTAHAEAMVTSAGPRAGLSVNPDQIALGGQLSLNGFAPNWSFDPNVELGFGDDVQVIALNLDGYYHMRLANSDWRPYVGGGLDITYFSVDHVPEWADNSDTEIGVNLVGGFIVPTRSDNEWFIELRLGVGDIPDLKIMTGINFKL
jgi:hypothetical protein